MVVMLLCERVGFIVWTRDLKNAKPFEKYGNVHYFSRKMQYVVLYVNASEEEQLKAQLEKLPYVKSVERSLRGEIIAEIGKSLPDKSRSTSL